MNKNTKTIIVISTIIAVIIIINLLIYFIKNKNTSFIDENIVENNEITSYLNDDLIDVQGKLVPKEKNIIKYGEQVMQHYKCLACHAVDMSSQNTIGGSFNGLYGKQVELIDGSIIIADENYIKESILNPKEKIVKGAKPIMPEYELNEEELNAIVSYLSSLK